MTQQTHTLHNGDCLAYLRGMADNSVDAIITDPPYFRVKDDAWDNQWATADKFLEWIDLQAQEWARVLKPNGSLWVFASPQMAARVEVTIGRRFNVLNHIKWRKPTGRHQGCAPEELRSFFPQTEAIVFAEHYGADNIAKGEAGYEAKCDELRGFVFEPLRAYLADAIKTAGWSPAKLNEAMGFAPRGMAETRYFGTSQWQLPTAEHYKKMRAIVGPQHLRREYEDLRREYEDLRREYEDLRREYEGLRRPFNLERGQPHTDVWDFDVVPPYEGKHPCEKPNELMRHIIATGTRPAAVVFDGFMGSGSTGVAAVQLGRRFIGCELSPSHFAQASARIEMAGVLDSAALRSLRMGSEDRDPHTVDLFKEAA